MSWLRGSSNGPEYKLFCNWLYAGNYGNDKFSILFTTYVKILSFKNSPNSPPLTPPLEWRYRGGGIDGARRNNLLTISSKNNNIHFAFNNINKCVNIQSAENCKVFSETIRQLSNSSDIEFYSWLAGIIDGDGNFDIRKNRSNQKLVLKAIRIKLHNRDVRILTRIQNYLNRGRIITDKNKPYSIYTISTREEMYHLIHKLNGLIRIKVDSFKKACILYNIEYSEPNYNIRPMVLLYDYFMKNRLYSDFKFYRVTQIKRFIEIRDYKNEPFESTEYQIYSDFLLNWIQYKNPLWTKVPFIKKLNIR